MFFNYIKIAYRNILKQKGYNFLNTIGLASGIACGLIIALHIQKELTYDKSYTEHQNIYRVHLHEWAKSSPTMASLMREEFPEMESIGRFASYGKRVVEGETPSEVQGYYADSTIFSVFDFTISQGDTKGPLVTSSSMVITESMARRVFGDEDPVGKTITFDNREKFVVTAVMQDLPERTHLKFDFLVSMKLFEERVSPEWYNNRGWMVMYTYARFKNAQAHEKALIHLPDFMRRYYEGWEDVDELVAEGALRFQPLADIHLGGNLEQEMNANGNIMYIYILMAVELLILIVASANFMSLFTTQAIKRMKEVGMRKILGANRRQVMSQFLTEVVLLVIFSLVLAVVFYQTILPAYNSISGNTLGVWDIFSKRNLITIGVIVASIIVFAGLYPAFYIAGFRSTSFLRESRLPQSFPNVLRKSLVVFQFVVSMALIASTLLVHQQMNLIQNKDLGFDKDQVVTIKLYGQLWWKAMTESEAFKSEFMKNPDVLAVGKVSNTIGDNLSVESVTPVGKDDEEFPSVRVLRIDDGYLDVMGIKFLDGRNFSTAFNDSASFIINKKAAEVLGLEHAVGEQINNQTQGLVGTVVGLVDNFHFASLHSTVEPLVMEYRPQWTEQLEVKISGGKTRETLSYLEATAKKIAPGALFTYSFLNDELNQLYRAEENISRIFELFALLAIVIACLGLFGLSAHTIELRTKEIGIRKVMGATVAGLVRMVSSSFFALVVVGFVIAVPITWYAVYQWLQGFAYKIDISIWVFVATGALTLFITAVAVGYNTISAATADPAKSLRYD